ELLNTVVIARSTPLVKLKVVKTLKRQKEVVAVTGDGINDAPAIKQADVGIVMGKTGSDITKEAADVLLLDDSFSTLVKAIKFGRCVYKNLQRFIIFQISVNVSALLVVTICAIIGVNAPFSTLQMLWINLIMDGPPALTLGLISPDNNLMQDRPVKREESIITYKMLCKILFNGIFSGIVVLMQVFFNFLGALDSEKSNAVFTLFIIFQLFNAFNCVELGSKSIFKNLGKNKVMLLTFITVFLLQIVITSLSGGLRFYVWLKILVSASSIVLLSEGYKFLYRILSNKKSLRLSINKNKIGA
ncbi:MAG: cation-translocating P-type ATPase, partial [Clostridia bacterium]|nr:cation-translocating P-type ATPase [Clostridia bacterium]